MESVFYSARSVNIPIRHGVTSQKTYVHLEIYAIHEMNQTSRVLLMKLRVKDSSNVLHHVVSTLKIKAATFIRNSPTNTASHPRRLSLQQHHWKNVKCRKLISTDSGARETWKIRLHLKWQPKSHLSFCRAKAQLEPRLSYCWGS